MPRFVDCVKRFSDYTPAVNQLNFAFKLIQRHRCFCHNRQTILASHGSALGRLFYQSGGNPEISFELN